MGKKRGLSLSDIVLMNVVAVASLRWIASAASNGPSSLSLWLLAGLFFFVPQAFAVIQLSSRYPGVGGLYRWTKLAAGDWHGFLCGWCYWVNNLLYFPTLLLYVASNIAFAVQAQNPQVQVESNKLFVTGITIGSLWLVAVLSLVGVQAGKRLQNLGAIANWIPAILVSILGLLSMFLYGSANSITWTTLLPRMGSLNQLSFFSQMCFALAGLELISFFGGDVENPRRNITRGIFISAVVILSLYLAGTFGILGAVPQEKITLLNGILLPLQEMGRRWDANWLPALCALFIGVAGLGSTMAWFSGAARVPYLVGVDKYLPAVFSRLHPKFQTPYIAILVQTAVATLFTLFATIGANSQMESAYKIMVDMCLILYFIPYCYLFLSLFLLRNHADAASEAGFTYTIPGGVKGTVLVSLVGLGTTLLAVVTTVIPVNGVWDYTALMKTLIGTGVMLAVGFALYLFGQGLTFRPGFEDIKT